MLGQICQERGEIKRAAHFFCLAAEMTQTESKVWEKIGFMYKEALCYNMAGYCFGRALKSDCFNLLLLHERAECYELMGEVKKAIKCYEKILIIETDSGETTKKCAKL